MTASPPMHGSCIAWQGRGVLILGAPGSGKSSLALECIDHGASLVADDAVLLKQDGVEIFASAPAALQGSLALRGLGILAMHSLERVPLKLIVTLDECLGREMMSLQGILLDSLHLPRLYPARIALMKQALYAASGDGVTWRDDDWRPERASA